MGLLPLHHGAAQMALMLLLLLAGARAADPAAENLTDTDEAEFRQGGIAQQLMAASSYPAGLYSASNAYQQYAAGTGAGTGAGGYMNMIRNLYRPPSMGLTDKVKHWVKSFMNRRQYVKPYYGAPGLQYSTDEFGGASGKPMLMSGGGYKAISIPLRQLQKYYKPYYGAEGGFPQQQSPGAASSSMLSYSPSGAGSGGLYASETAAAGHYAGGSSGGLFGAGGSNSGGLFGSGSSSGLFGAGAGSSSGGLFGTGSDGSSLFSGSPSSGLFSSGGQGGIYSSGGSYYSPSGDGGSSALFSASGLQGLYGSGGASSGGLYLPNGAGSSAGGSSGYSLDAGSSFGSDGGSSSYLGGGGDYGSRTAAASSLLSSLGASGGASQYGDLYASGASPAATVYNPSSGGHQGRGYGGSSGGSKKQQQQQQQQQQSYGASSSALYVPSSSDSMRSPESYPMKSAQEAPQLNSFNVDSSRNSPAEASYSVSFQPAQGKSYSAPYENAGFQPVAFGAEDGFKGKSS